VTFGNSPIFPKNIISGPLALSLSQNSFLQFLDEFDEAGQISGNKKKKKVIFLVEFRRGNFF